MQFLRCRSSLDGHRFAGLRFHLAGIAVTLAAMLVGCGGGGDSGAASQSLRPSAGQQAAPLAAAADGAGGKSTAPEPSTATAQAAGSEPATARQSLAGGSAGADPGLLLLLIPDGTSLADSRIGAWQHAAVETGVRLMPVTDSEFMALGSGALRYGGLVLPDTLHSVASDEVIAAVRAYVQSGGRAMLTYDFGALYRGPSGDVFYAAVRSRLSDMAGVEYILYDELRDFTIGIGPVTGMRSMLRTLQVPPGKSMPYEGTTRAASAMTARTPSASALPLATVAGADQPRFLPSSPADPGGLGAFDFQQYSNVRLPSLHDRPVRRPKGEIQWGRSRIGPAVPGVTRAIPSSSRPKLPAATGSTRAPLGMATTGGEPELLDAYSGYFYGHLSYPSYVTRGSYAGTTLLTSPHHGLVAGVHPFGSGQVLFVNLPLTHLKGQTDALPMHGFLRYFAIELGASAFMSPMPDGVAGMNFNWHLDGKEAQRPTLRLEQRGVFSSANPFTIHMTAGPDVVNFGDGLGWDLNNNSTAKKILRRFAAAGHDVGNHGGWIHDYYGGFASETNESGFLQYLQLNAQAVDGLLGRASRSYSAPQGNNPNWAMTWLEQQGVVAAYFLGHTGVGATRHYRDGVLKNPKLYVVPLTPFGVHATFEEFQDNALTKQEVIDWYHALVDFVVAHNTNRMVYAHPPGADAWPDVMDDLLAYSRAKGTGSFRWYTMPQLADHLARINRVTWSESVGVAGESVVTASHPHSLDRIVWHLPKSHYLLPVVISGAATVTDRGGYWQVAPTGTSVTFQAMRTGG